MKKRKPVIGVMGGSKVSKKDFDMARKLGSLIAQKGWVLLNGGRNTGVMAASAMGAKEKGGTVIGVLPDNNAKKASPDLDFVIVTGIGYARNVINVLSSDVVIACPGSVGTISEVMYALNYKKKVILLGLDPGPGVDAYYKKGLLHNATTPRDAVALAARILKESK